MKKALEAFLSTAKRFATAWTGVQFILGIAAPNFIYRTRLASTFVVLTTIGAMLGFYWAKREPLSSVTLSKCAYLFRRGLAAVLTYIVLEASLPFVGLIVPIIYESDTLFWVLVMVRAGIWATGFGIITRTFVLLRRLP